MLFQRLFTLSWLTACAVLAVFAWQYQTAFSYEPVGPRAYPLLILGLTAIGLIYLTIRPTHLSKGHDDHPLDNPTLRKIGLCILMLLAYAALFEPLGLIVSSSLVGIGLAMLYGAPWKPAVLVSLGLAIGLYLLFDKVLDVPLPLGLLSVLE